MIGNGGTAMYRFYFYKGIKFLHGWDKVWGLALCILVGVIAGMYKAGELDGIISRICRVWEKIDHLIDHSVNRPSDKR